MRGALPRCWLLWLAHLLSFSTKYNIIFVIFEQLIYKKPVNFLRGEQLPKSDSLYYNNRKCVKERERGRKALFRRLAPLYVGASVDEKMEVLP